jgi:bifunctional ADP-heptose synthase (sugar kinase/adenylyltransferase)
LIDFLKPDILVKGSDYSIDKIVGADVVIANGGRVETMDFIEGYSSTNIINKIINTK